MNCTRLILLLLTFLAISGEAATFGAGVIRNDFDQTHDRSGGEAEIEVREDRSIEDEERPDMGPAAFLRTAATLRLTPPVAHAAGRPAAGARPCGTTRRHRWLGVDLN